MNALKNAFSAKKGSASSEVEFCLTAGSQNDKLSSKVECALDDFEMSTTLGTGTFGRVRLVKFKRHAQVENSSKFYALKVLKKQQMLILKQLAHIRNEVSLLSEIDHPFIVNMVNHFQDETRLFMVLEFVPGGELFTFLRNEGRLGNDESRFYASQIVMAFGYLHDKGIAYRDLKPENLLITRTGYLKIADFGFAKKIDGRTWTLCGTPEYLAPEIIQSKGHGFHVDWWACGVLIYEMLAGYPPFYDENPFGIYQKILAGQVDYPRHMDAKAVVVIKSLLVADLSKRLGCLKGGVRDIQKLKWFAKTKWKDIFERTVEAPYKPTILSEDDTSNFDEYPDSMPCKTLDLSLEEIQAFEQFNSIGFQSITTTRTPDVTNEGNTDIPQLEPTPAPQDS